MAEEIEMATTYILTEKPSRGVETVLVSMSCDEQKARREFAAFVDSDSAHAYTTYRLRVAVPVDDQMKASVVAEGADPMATASGRTALLLAAGRLTSGRIIAEAK